MQYPITYAYPAKTFSRIALGLACAGLGLIGVIFNLATLLQSFFDLNVGPFVVSLCLLVFGSGILWSMHTPRQIALTKTDLILPKNLIGGEARTIPYADVIGVSLILHKWSRTAIIYTTGEKFAFTTHAVGHKNFFDLIDQLHAHADLGPPPVGTLAGLFRAGRGAMMG